MFDSIVNTTHDDGNGGRRFHCGANRWSCSSDDDVHLPLHKFGSEARKTIRLAVGISGLIYDRPPLGVAKIRQLLDEDALGKLYYYDSTRVNLGLFQHDVNVIWDLAPHDLSIVDYLIGGSPDVIVATGEAHFNGLTDVAFITAYYPGNVIAHINVNWLSPLKVRTTLIGGERKMLVWNDLEADEKIKVYDKGVHMTTREGVYELLVSYRSGDMWAPKVEATEALSVELGYFVECIENDMTPFNDGIAGLRVVRMLEAVEESLKRKGEAVYA